jgi:ribosomal protein S8
MPETKMPLEQAMSQQDLTADMLTRIRNAVRNGAKTVKCLNCKLNRGVAQVLVDEGYITGFDVIDDGRQGLRDERSSRPQRECRGRSRRRRDLTGRAGRLAQIEDAPPCRV